MENVVLTDNVFKTKKIFFRKELDVSQAGEKVYSSEIIHPQSVYVSRKFILVEEYKQTEHFEALIRKLPEKFQQEFDSIFIKEIYRDIRPESVNITLLLTTEQPLTKAQVISIRRWIGQLKVKGLFVAKETKDEEKKFFQLLRGLKETNTQVMLLTDIINQLNGDMKNIYQDVRLLKEQKIDLEMDASSTGEEAEQKIAMLTVEIEQVTREFSTFKTSLQKKIQQLSRNHQPREFKLVKGNHDSSIVTAEQQLKEALVKIEELTNKVVQSDERLAKLQTVVQEQKEAKSIVEETAMKNDNKHKQIKIVAEMKTTNKKVNDVTQELKKYNNKLVNIENTLSKVHLFDGKITDLESKNSNSTVEVNKVVKVVQQMIEQCQKDQQQLRGNQQQINHLVEKITTQNNELKEACQKINELEKKLSSVTASQNSQEQVKNNTKEIQKLSTSKNKLDLDVARISEQLTQIEKDSFNKKEYKNIQEKLQTNTNEISKLSILTTTLESKVNEVQTDLIDVKKDSTIQDKIQKNTEEIHKLTKTTEGFNHQVTETNEKIDLLEQKILNKKESSKTEAQLQSHTIKLKKLIVTTDVLDDQFTKTQEELDTLKEKVLMLESEEQYSNEETNTVRNFRNLSDNGSNTLIYGNMKSAEFNREMKKFPLKEVLVRNDFLDETDESLVNFSHKDMITSDSGSKKDGQPDSIYIDNFKPNDLSLSHEYAVKELEKLEEKIPTYFDDTNIHGIQRGKIKKEDFYPTLRKIEIVPYLWFNIFRKEKKDILIGNMLSCKQLVDELSNFLDEIENTERKKLIRSKWIYFSKEVEQKIEGYKLFSDYLELYYHVNQTKRA